MSWPAQPARWEKLVWPSLFVFLVILAWHLAVTATHTKIFPSPIEVLRGLTELIRKGLLWRYIGDSLRRVLTGYGIAVAIGIPLGLGLRLHQPSYRTVNPALQLLRPISPIAWIPIAIILFGIGDRASTFLIFLGAFFPVVLTCVAGVSRVPEALRRAGVNFGLGPLQLLIRVIFPAALPEMLVGFRVAFGIAWLVVVAAEMIAVDSGLGYLVIDSRNAGKRYDLVLAAILIIGLIGLVLDSFFRLLERAKLVRWGFRNAA